MNQSAENALEVRTRGDRSNPCLIYLPGIHGDWTLFTSFCELAKEHFFVVEVTYPRTLEWTMDDYAQAVSGEIEKLGISRGWVLGESYSSQVAWSWLKMAQGNRASFQWDGLILAGGFVRYPFPWVVRVAGRFFDVAPWRLWKMLFWISIRYSRFRHRHAPESGLSAHEFVARRTELDMAAIRHRLRLIADYNAREAAAAARCPVYLLAGTIDPVVPTWPVLRWLRKHCPGFKAHRIIWPADHNVLGTEPAKSLHQIRLWAGGR